MSIFRSGTATLSRNIRNAQRRLANIRKNIRVLNHFTILHIAEHERRILKSDIAQWTLMCVFGLIRSGSIILDIFRLEFALTARKQCQRNHRYR